MKKIRAKIYNGFIKPLETISYPEGKEVYILIEIPTGKREKGFKRSAGGWKGTLDAEELKKNIYADRL